MTRSAPGWPSGRTAGARSRYRSIPFSPVVEADALPVTPWRALADGAGRDIDLLVGHTRDEHRLFTALDGLLGQVTDEQAETALDILAPGPDGARRYREGFPAAGPDELHELVNSDWAFRMPTLHLAEAQTAGGGRAHVYELTWPAPGMGGSSGPATASTCRSSSATWTARTAAHARRGPGQLVDVGAAAACDLGLGEVEGRHAKRPVGVDHLVELVRPRGREALPVAARPVRAGGENVQGGLRPAHRSPARAGRRER